MAFLQSKETHDYWNIYKFGDSYKITYVKHGNRPSAGGYKAKGNEAEGRFSQSISRTKNRIFELAACNEFRFFCTFTIDEKKHDRYDLSLFRKDFAQFIRNLNRGRDDDHKIKYLVVPEQHKDGAWHFHGLLLGLTENDLKTNEFGYYDWEAYSKRFGFFNCSPIKKHKSCASYITKYIEKGLEDRKCENSSHLYFASQGLRGAECILRHAADGCPCTSWDYENDWVKIKWLDNIAAPFL